MKKHNYLLILLLLVFNTSCDDFLNVRPQSKLDTGFVFGSVDNAKSAVMSVYSILLRLEENCFRSFAYTADDASGNYNSNPDDGIMSSMRYDLKPINTTLTLPFTALYAGIDRANICIVEISKMSLFKDGNEAQKFELRRLLGEAYTLRALYYFELIKNWGDVPASFDPSLTQADLYLPKTDRYIIYETILSDLKYASESLLPWRTEPGVERDERITKGAAKALRARIALFAGGYSLRKNNKMERPEDYSKYYEIARDECFELMQHRDQHTLNPSYESVFKLNCSYQKDSYGEIMLEIGFKAGETGRYGYYDGPNYTYPGEVMRGATLVYALPTYFYAFDSLDVRRDVAIALGRPNFGTHVRTATTLQALVNGKFRIDWVNPLPAYSNPLYTGVNFPIIRFSDVLLMYAEAENELNGPGNAIAALEEVRTRGFGGNKLLIGTTPSTKVEFFEAVMKERLLELGIEAVRKYDLIRWNRLESTLRKTKEELQKMSDKLPPYNEYPVAMYYKGNSWDLIWAGSFYEPDVPKPANYTLTGWIGSMTNSKMITNYAVFFTPGKSELLPLPKSVVDSNPKLSQDYGY